MGQAAARLASRAKMPRVSNSPPWSASQKCLPLWWGWIKNKHMWAMKLKLRREFSSWRSPSSMASLQTGRTWSRSGITLFTRNCGSLLKTTPACWPNCPRIPKPIVRKWPKSCSRPSMSLHYTWQSKQYSPFIHLAEPQGWSSTQDREWLTQSPSMRVMPFLMPSNEITSQETPWPSTWTSYWMKQA